MSAITTWHCDGTCKRKMTEAEVIESNDMARMYAESRKLDQNGIQMLAEVFCPECRERAADYWDSKTFILQEISRQFKARLENHRNKFWVKKLEAVK